MQLVSLPKFLMVINFRVFNVFFFMSLSERGANFGQQGMEIDFLATYFCRYHLDW